MKKLFAAAAVASFAFVGAAHAALFGPATVKTVDGIEFGVMDIGTARYVTAFSPVHGTCWAPVSKANGYLAAAGKSHIVQSGSAQQQIATAPLVVGTFVVFYGNTGMTGCFVDTSSNALR